MFFLSPMSNFTNGYATSEKKWGGDYGHDYKNCSESELVKWFGVLTRDGARGGSSGHLSMRWSKKHPGLYDDDVDKAMGWGLWQQIKGVLKMNYNAKEFPKGEPSYDPTNKFDFILKVIAHNMNQITLKASDDQCMDETSWAFHGYGGDVVNDVSNKPSVNRGGQTTICCDVKTGFPRAFVHRWRKKPYATGFTSHG